MLAIPQNAHPRSRGFSLIELAIVLVIVGILMSGVLVALGETTESARRAQAQAQINTIMEALYGFAQTNGRLPCPDTDADGIEEATCTLLNNGFIPIQTLGLSGRINNNNLADPWGNSYLYAVAPYQAGAFTTDISTLFPGALPPGNPQLLSICAVAGCAVPLTDTSPAVILSTGRNGANTPPGNFDELENTDCVDPPGNGTVCDNFFVSADYSDENFDDIVAWLSPYVLYTRLVSAGRLP